MLWRHGDVLIGAISAIPPGAHKKHHCTLAHGEVTGHSHRIERMSDAELYEADGQLFLRILSKEARVIHEEHQPITLPQGTYRVWQQREYTPDAIRRIVD